MTTNQIVKILRKACKEGLALDVTYTNSYGMTSEYVIWDIEPDREYGNGRFCREGYIRAYCGLKDNVEYNDYYTFKISRFEEIYLDEDDYDEDEFDEDEEEEDENELYDW